MKDAAKKFRKTCEKCNKPFSAASEEETPLMPPYKWG